MVVDKYVKVIQLKKSFKSPKTLYPITININLKMYIVYVTLYYPTRLLSIKILENNGRRINVLFFIMKFNMFKSKWNRQNILMECRTSYFSSHYSKQ